MFQTGQGMTALQEYLWIRRAIFSVVCVERDKCVLFYTNE